MSSFFHQVTLPEDQSRYFRYVGGQPSEITAAEYQATVGSGINGAIVGMGLLGIRGGFGGAWYGFAGTRVVTAIISGPLVKRLGGAVDGSVLFPDLSIFYKVNVVGTSFGPDDEGDGQEDDEGGTTGGGTTGSGSLADFGGTGSAVADPPEPDDAPPAPLPPGNGNGGFQSSSVGGVQLGITGGNTGV
jgi:hypothetical protein